MKNQIFLIWIWCTDGNLWYSVVQYTERTRAPTSYVPWLRTVSSVAAPPRHPVPSISNTSVMYWMYSLLSVIFRLLYFYTLYYSDFLATTPLIWGFPFLPLFGQFCTLLGVLLLVNNWGSPKSPLSVKIYPLMTEVLKFEYVNAQNFKYGTTVECVKKLTHTAKNSRFS